MSQKQNVFSKTEKVTTFKNVTKYKSKSGDNIGEIASKYDVSAADIRKWNNIKETILLLERIW
jgi:membrane-bound lytic murein transglycosylase D